MLTIRLQRTGKKNQAQFRVVLAEKESHVSKKFSELLGSYNPHRKSFTGNIERLNYWISQRVDMSPTVHNLLVTNGILKSDKTKAFNIPKKPVEAAAPEAAAPAATEESTDTAPATESAPAEETAPAAPAEAPTAEPAAEPTPEAPTETPTETPAA